MTDVYKPIPSVDRTLLVTEYRALGVAVKTGTVTVNQDFGELAKGLYVGNAGDITVRKLDGTEQTFKNFPGGAFLPVACFAVVTPTLATEIVWLS